MRRVAVEHELAEQAPVVDERDEGERADALAQDGGVEVWRRSPAAAASGTSTGSGSTASGVHGE